MTKPRQDDLARQRRMNEGRCPIHGAMLVTIETTLEGRLVVACTRDECDFTYVVRPGSKLDRAMRPKKTGT